MGVKYKRILTDRDKALYKILCLYIVLILLISIIPITGISTKPDISPVIDSSNDYANITVTITSSVDVSSFIDWNNSLVAYYNFENDSLINELEINDNSTHDNNGTCVNGLTTEKNILGRYGRALYFNGSGNGYINVNDSNSLDLTDELTIELWFKEFETSFNETYDNSTSTGNQFDGSCLSLDKTDDGGYIATGYIEESSGSSYNDVWLVKIDSNGREEWNETFGESGKDEKGYSVIQTSDGGYIISGYKRNDFTERDVWVIKTDSNGENGWKKPYGSTGLGKDQIGYSIIENNIRNYVVTGSYMFLSPSNVDSWVFEINKDTHLITENHTYGGSLYDRSKCVKQTNDDGYIISGSTRSYGSGDQRDNWLVKINSDYTEKWNRTFGDKSKPDLLDEGYYVYQTADGGYILTGYTFSYNESGESDIWVIKTNEWGNETIWDNKTFGGTGDDQGLTVIETAERGYAIFGTIETTEVSSRYKHTLIKLNSTGSETWNRTFNTNSEKFDEGELKETNDGGFVFGSNSNSSGNSRFWIVKTDSYGNITESNNDQSLNKTLIGKGRDSYQLELCNGTITGYLNGTEVVTNTTNLYNLSQNWNHLVLTYNKNATGDKKKLYLNKELVNSSNSFDGSISKNIKNITIGRNFSGIIDEVKIWKRALTHEEINASYNANDAGTYYSNFTGLSSGTYNYKIHAINSDGKENDTDGSITIQTTNTPIVTSNASTGIGETNATLRGYLSDDGGEACTLGFRYGTNPGSYNENFSIAETHNSGTTFSNNNQSLTPGQIYYYQAWANNSAGFSTGLEKTFLTKPNATVSGSLTAQTNSSKKIYLSWIKGDGANKTYIERNTISSWARGSGTEIYNNTDTNYEDTGLTASTTYYYQAWSFANWTYDSTTLHQWSDENLSTSNTTPVIMVTNVSPANQSTGVSLNPTLEIQLNNSFGYSMNISWYWNTSSDCSYKFGSNNSVINGTYYKSNTNFSSYETTYFWKISINDSNGNWLNNTYHFQTDEEPSTDPDPSPGSSTTTQEEETDTDNETDTNNDITGPSITIITPKNGEIIYDKTPKIKASFSDESGINTSSIVFKLDGNTKTPSINSGSIVYIPSSEITIGAHTVNLKVSDTAGNSNSKSWSFKIEQSEYHETQNITNSTKGNKTIINPTNKTKTIVDRIEIKPNKNYENIEIEITDIGENISKDIEKPNATKIEKLQPEIKKEYYLYRYLQISLKSNDTYISEDIGDVKINFTVTISWVSNNTIDLPNISMLRYHNDSWEKLNTTLVKYVDNSTVLYQSITPGFSTFAVVGSKVIKKEGINKKPSEIPWIMIIGFIAAAIAVLMVILFKAGYIYIEEKEE